MQPIHAPLLALALLAAPLASQNVVTNGDFSNGLTGWTEAGYSVMNAIESFDTTGLGTSPCYACNPGGQIAPGPYPPNSIEQTVVLFPGPAYEFTAEVAVDAAANNSDAGAFWVEVGGAELTRTTLGAYVNGFPQRARLCARFTVLSGGPQTLRINFARTFVSNQRTPRSRIDDITLQLAAGPMFCLRGNRQLGKTVTVDVLGAPSEPVLFFLSPARLGSGIQVPGFNGTWFLDPTGLLLFFSGTTDATGLYTFALPLPNDPALLTAVVFVQGLAVAAGPQINLGHDQFLTFVK